MSEAVTASEIGPAFAVGDPATGVEVLGTLAIEGTTTGARPELFLSRPPSPAETRLLDHPRHLVTLRITPR